VYISGKGNGGFMGQGIGKHTLGGPGAHVLTHQVNSDVNSAKGHFIKDAQPAGLYNLEEDPYQKVNLYREQPETADQMKAFLDRCMKSNRTAPERS
jgi:hypothetical protein